ncbi:MAG: CoA activase, partial [Deltaproteobacteria bacterium]|nr:CoA activase [Deltaproteobacteria bacterium]
MEKVTQLDTFRSVSKGVGRFNVQGKRLLIPQMNQFNSQLLAGVFKSFGVNAKAMETYEGLDLGKKYTSGKECFPCIVTLGDILLFMKKERERLGESFNPENYIYFMPDADGPCRFGMYNKFHRIILDSIPGLDKVKISELNSDDAYDLKGLIPKENLIAFRKAGYLSIVVGDILDRLVWRVRMAESFARHSSEKDLSPITDDLIEVVKEGKDIIDPRVPRKPLIGAVGEIYLRSHVKSNQDTIRILEKYGAEVVNASIGEWINYTTYDQVRLARIAIGLNLKRFKLKE